MREGIKVTISPLLLGGIGNRLFQVAAAKYVAQVTGLAFVLKPDYVKPNAHGLNERDNWYFRHIARESSGSSTPIHFVNDIWGQSPEALVTRVNRLIEKLDPDQDTAIVLRGYFQNEAFFNAPNHAAKIREWFTWPHLLTELPADENKLYAVHVRRGDYKNNAYHEVLTCNDQLHAYYHEAAKEFPNNAECLVFSDDVDWCRSHFNDKAHFVDQKLGSFESLQLMSRCRLGVVMANSSFSWWGAWLNQNPQKIVTMPSRWYGPRGRVERTNLFDVTSYSPIVIEV